MKSLIKKLINSKLLLNIRNTLNIKPIYLDTTEKGYFTTVSDAFLWRTDNGYKTKFKYSDILNLFYKIDNSWVEFHFFSKENKLIKIKKVNSLNLSNELEITKEFLNNTEDYGIFYIYHFSRNENGLHNKSTISNRCYLGYSQNNNLYSFVHGNVMAKYTSVNTKEKILSDIVKTSLFKNQIYTIQKYFNDFSKNELFFINPTSKKIKFTVENKEYELNSHCGKMLETNSNIISIKSNCLFFRPTIFSYKNNYMDVHHS